MSSPLKIGLTGCIGCGKTTVLQLFRQMGVPCFIADEVAAGYYDDPQFVAQVADLLGQQVVRPDGSVDKQAVAQIVFSNRQRLLQLNALVHPRVMQSFLQWCDRQDAPYVLFESAIIYEYQLEKYLDKVIVVYLEKEERLRRLVLRDHTSRERLEARMRNQISAEEKLDRGDYVILNYEGNPRQRQVEHVDRLIRANHNSFSL